MPQGVAALAELGLQGGAVDARLGGGGLGLLVDGEHPAEVAQVHGEHRRMIGACDRLDPADHAAAPPIGDQGELVL